MFFSTFCKANLMPYHPCSRFSIHKVDMRETVIFSRKLYGKEAIPRCTGQSTLSCIQKISCTNCIAYRGDWKRSFPLFTEVLQDSGQWPMLPDAGIKSSPKFLNVAQQSTHSSVSLKSVLFQIAQKVAKYLGKIFKKHRCKEISKIVHSGHTDNGPK